MITPITAITPGLFEISERNAKQLDAAGVAVYERKNMLGFTSYFALATCPRCGKNTEKPGALCAECLPI